MQHSLLGFVTIELEGEDFEIDLEELQADLKIDRANLGDELSHQPGMYAWIAALSAQADYDVGRVKQTLSSVRAALGKELRAENVSKGKGERLTVDGVAELIDTDSTVETLQQEFLQRARKAALLNGFREALRQRSQMLTSLASLARGEMHFSSVE